MDGKAKLASVLFFVIIIGPIATLTIPDSDVEGAFNAENDYLAGRGGDDNSSIINWTLANSLQYVDEWARSFSFSSNGALLATGYGGGIVTVDDDSSNIWLVDYSSPDAWIADNVNSVMFSPDDNFLAVGHDAGLAVWNVSTWNEVVSYTNITNVYSLCFSPDGKQLATGGSDGNVRIWNTSTWDEVENYSASPHRIASLAYSPNGSMLISGSTDFVGWNTSNWSAIFSIPGEPASGGAMIYSIEFSPQGDVFVTGEGCVIRIWNTTNVTSVSRHEIDPLGDWCTAAYDVSFSSDGNYLAFGSYDSNQNSSLLGGQISILDTNSWSLSDNITPQRGIATALEFRPGDSLLASGGSEGEGYQLWVRDSDDDGVMDSADACSGTAQGFPADENGCSASQRDTDEDGLVDSLDRCPGTEVGIEVDGVGCWWGQFDTDGDGVQNSEDTCPKSNSNSCEIPSEWHLSERSIVLRQCTQEQTLTCKEESSLTENYDPQFNAISEIRFSSDGLLFATILNRDSVMIFDSQSKNQIAKINISSAHSISFSNDGTILAIGGDANISLWNTSNWQQIGLIGEEGGDHINKISFSPDDKYLAYANTYPYVTRVIDLTNDSGGEGLFCHSRCAIVHNFTSPYNRIYSMDFSPDGSHFALSTQVDISGEFDVGLIVFETTNWSVEFTDAYGQITDPPEGRSQSYDNIRDLQFSTNNEWLITGSMRGEIRVY